MLMPNYILLLFLLKKSWKHDIDQSVVSLDAVKVAFTIAKDSVDEIEIGVA